MLCYGCGFFWCVMVVDSFGVLWLWIHLVCYSAIQLIARADGVQSLYDLKPEMTFLLHFLPLCKGVKLKYKLAEVEDACDDRNMNRYLSQNRSHRGSILYFVAFGIVSEDCSLRGVDVTEPMGFEAMRFGTGHPFDEVWPKQMILLDHLHVSLFIVLHRFP